MALENYKWCCQQNPSTLHNFNNKLPNPPLNCPTLHPKWLHFKNISFITKLIQTKIHFNIQLRSFLFVKSLFGNRLTVTLKFAVKTFSFNYSTYFFCHCTIVRNKKSLMRTINYEIQLALLTYWKVYGWKSH